MPLTLTIENETTLPDGGPLSFRLTGRRGCDIGRDTHLDWTLPDPTRAISGKHCEVRWQDGGYSLYDVSTNGTYVNRSDRRMQGPHRLRDGDRIEIGHYVIAVALDGEEAGVPAPSTAPASPQEFWGPVGDVAPPISAREFHTREQRPVNPDFLDWAVDTPTDPLPPEPRYEPVFPPPPQPPMPPAADMAWAGSPPPAPVSEPPPPVPTPRRPPAAGHWDAPPAPPPSPAAEGWGSPAAPAPPQAPPAFAPATAPPDNPWGTPSFATPSAAPASPPPAFQPPPAAPFAFQPPPSPSMPTGAPGTAPADYAAAPPPAYAAAAAPPAPAAPALPQPGGAQPGTIGAEDFLRRVAKGAGVPPETFARRDPGELAEELGALLHLVVTDLKQLLAARAESKRMARSSSQTMIQALDNNPLKFSPTAEDALRVMFGAPAAGYLDARRTVEQSFKDLKLHQLKTYSAMQHALRMLVEDLDPEAIDEATEGGSGLGALMSSRKGRLWDTYVARWQAMTAPHEDGLVGAFMLFFAECYDRGGGVR